MSDHPDDHAPGNQPSDLRTHADRSRPFPAPGHRPPPARLKLVRPRPRRTAARRALQLDPGPARRPQPAATSTATTKVASRPRRPSGQATGLIQCALLTTGVLMGAATVTLGAGGADTDTQRAIPDPSPARTLAPSGVRGVVDQVVTVKSGYGLSLTQ
jgi:hypothetical protein